MESPMGFIDSKIRTLYMHYNNIFDLPVCRTILDIAN